MKWLLLIFLCPFYSLGQQEIEVNFIFTFNGEPLEEEKWYLTDNKDSIRLETVQFFVSQDPKKNNPPGSDKVQLIDWKNKASHAWDTQVTNTLNFTLGLDSIYHVSSIMTGDLDPSLGMYWAWQSGYIQLKIEGESPSSTARKNKFEYHLGGYLAPFAVSSPLHLGTISGNEARVEVQLDTFFEQLNIAENEAVLIPGKKAQQLMQQAKSMFILK